MSTRLRAAAAVAVLALLPLSGCADGAASGSTPAAGGSTSPSGSAPVVAAPDSRPDSEVPEARVPIAAVAPEAQEVNQPEPEQAEGIRMTSDKGKGLTEEDVTDTAMAGGCVPDYGKDGQCLPPVPPRLVAEHAGHRGMDPLSMAMFYTCEDVLDLIPDGLVTSEDPLGLDTNDDGIACGKGDKGVS